MWGAGWSKAPGEGSPDRISLVQICMPMLIQSITTECVGPLVLEFSGVLPCTCLRAMFQTQRPPLASVFWFKRVHTSGRSHHSAITLTLDRLRAQLSESLMRGGLTVSGVGRGLPTHPASPSAKKWGRRGRDREREREREREGVREREEGGGGSGRHEKRPPSLNGPLDGGLPPSTPSFPNLANSLPPKLWGRKGGTERGVRQGGGREGKRGGVATLAQPKRGDSAAPTGTSHDASLVDPMEGMPAHPHPLDGAPSVGRCAIRFGCEHQQHPRAASHCT